jgi:hypothetical protein
VVRRCTPAPSPNTHATSFLLDPASLRLRPALIVS